MFDRQMFFSLDRPVNQNKMLSEVFLISFQYKKRSRQSGLFSFHIEIATKTLADIWCLVFCFQSPAYPMKRTIEIEVTPIIWVKITYDIILSLEIISNQKVTFIGPSCTATLTSFFCDGAIFFPSNPFNRVKSFLQWNLSWIR